MSDNLKTDLANDEKNIVKTTDDTISQLDARLSVLESEWSPEAKQLLSDLETRLAAIEAKIGPEAVAWFEKIEAFAVRVEERLRMLRFW